MVDTANDVAVEKGIPADAKQVDINFVNAILQSMQNNLNSLMAQKVRLEANEIILAATVKELQEKMELWDSRRELLLKHQLSRMNLNKINPV